MSWWKEKRNLRLRVCHLRISKNCTVIFKTKFKRTGKRTTCPECKELLRKLKTNVEAYIKMEEPTEKLEWIGENEIRATFEKKVEKNGKLDNIQTKVEMVTVEDMKEGIENIKQKIKRNIEQIAINKRNLKRLGKIPAKTSEMVRLEKNLRDVQLISQAEKIKTETKEMEEEILTNQKVVENREKFLKSR